MFYFVILQDDQNKLGYNGPLSDPRLMGYDFRTDPYLIEGNVNFNKEKFKQFKESQARESPLTTVANAAIDTGLSFFKDTSKRQPKVFDLVTTDENGKWTRTNSTCSIDRV